MAHMICLWAGLFMLVANAMKRAAEDSIEGNVIKRRNTMQDTATPPDKRKDLMCSIPVEIIQHYFIPLSAVSSALSLSMTSKSMHEIVSPFFHTYYKDKQDIIYDELIESRGNYPMFMLIRQALISVWPTSDNCMDRFYLKDALYALLVHASKKQDVPETHDNQHHVPLPFFFPADRDKGYHYVPGTSSCAVAVLKHKVYKDFVLSPDLILEVPKDLLLDFGRHSFQNDPPFPWTRENDSMLRIQLDFFVSLRGLNVITSEYNTSTMLALQKLLDDGLCACLDYIVEQQLYDWDEKEGPILELMLEMAEPCHMEKLVEVVKLMRLTNFVSILCESPKLSDDILLEIFEEITSPVWVSKLIMMIDSGRMISENWIRHDKSEIDQILASYNEETMSYDVTVDGGWQLAEESWFIAHARGLNDDRLIGLLHLFKKYVRAEMFCLSLQLGRSERVIKNILSVMNLWGFYESKDLPRNYVIPKQILPEVVLKSYQTSDLLKLFPDEPDFIENVMYIDKSGLWNSSLCPSGLLRKEIQRARKNVIQLLMELVEKDNFNDFRWTTRMNCSYCDVYSGIVEYLMVIPTQKLFNALIGENMRPILCHMFTLILHVLLSRPDGFIILMKSEDPTVIGWIKYSVETAWQTRFSFGQCPFKNENYLIFYFFYLIEEFSRDKIELEIFLYYFGMRILKWSVKDSFPLGVPNYFNRRQLDITKSVLKTALAVLDLDELLVLETSIDDPLISTLLNEEIIVRCSSM